MRDHDVYVYDLAAGKESAVTTSGTAIKTHGLAEFVAQEEMYRFSGYWWSPDSRSLVYEEADASDVETWYVADPDLTVAETRRLKRFGKAVDEFLDKIGD